LSTLPVLNLLLDARAGPQVQVSVQPLCLLHRPLCFQRLAALGAALPDSTQGGRLLESINRLPDPAGRMLCKARLVEDCSAPPEINVQVRTQRLAFTVTHTS